MMAGIRFLSAGGLLLAYFNSNRPRFHRSGLCSNAALIRHPAAAVGNGFVTTAEHQHVPSGIAAVMVATVPLFTLCFSRFWYHHPQD